MRILRHYTCVLLISNILGTTLAVYAQNPTHPILFCTQVPHTNDFATVMSTFANHEPSMQQAPRGGDLYIRYPNGNLKNLTQVAGYGETGLQGDNAIAVRDPHVHWSGTKALFSMVIGAPQHYQWEIYYWQIYEISGLGENDTPVITKVANQPDNYNNVNAIYGTDDRILFVSDCPRGEAVHLYPQHDEYESETTVTGLWRIDPNACPGTHSLEMLTHSPSGDFTPIIDSYGRVVFIRWDHLKRDQQADADIIYGNTYGTFNYSDESANAAKTSILPDIEIFPEPRTIRTDLFALPEWQNTNSHDFNIFNPWMINEDGTELETLNHIGRHELTSYFNRNFTNDSNLNEFIDTDGVSFRNFFHIQESPVTPGLYYGTNAPEFGTHASGMVASLYLPEGMPADSAVITYITHPDTRFSTDTPSPEHSGLYRDPIPLNNGDILVTHSSTTEDDANIGTFNMPISKYDFRLQLLEPDGNYYKADGNYLTGNGISKSISYYNPDNLISYNGLLWETFPVVVKPRPLPTTSTLNTQSVPTIEQALFADANVDMNAFQNYLKRQDLALIVTRNVTSRDIADRQQPFNLKVTGNGTQTINPQFPGNIYEVKYMQYLQGDQIRGIGGITNPKPGRRVIAQYMHDSAAMQYNLPSTGAQGSVDLESDGSVAAIVPANRAMTWQLTDANNHPVVRERIWMSFVPGEIRICTSCHGENQINQAGLLAPTNPPLALTSLLNHVKNIDTDGDYVSDIEDYYPNDASRQYGESLNEDFVNQLTDWLTDNGGNDAVTWNSTTVNNCNDEVAVINNRLEDNTGTADLLSRTIDLSDFSTARLQFDLAYARFDNTHFDGLKVKINTCDGTASTTIYDKSGTALATAPDETDLFAPADCSEWRTECVDISAYIGEIVELVFENTGGWGNQLFLDNILVAEDSPVTGCTDTSPTHIALEDTGIIIHSTPLDDILTIKGIIGSYEIDILYADGTVYQTLKGTNTLNIDISRMPVGMYLLSIVQDGNASVRVEKILKM